MQNFSALRLGEPNVPTYIIYNSQIDTLLGLNFKNGYENDATYENIGGDGTVPKPGPEWACQNWAQTNQYPVICHDLYSTDASNFDHSGMSYNPYVHDLIFKAANDEDWEQLKGNYYERSPKVTVTRANESDFNSPSKYEIHNDVRSFVRRPFKQMDREIIRKEK